MHGIHVALVMPVSCEVKNKGASSASVLYYMSFFAVQTGSVHSCDCFFSPLIVGTPCMQ